MCNGNCTCKDKITTEWVDDNGRQQLKFAVPSEGENEVVVDRVEDLKGEIRKEYDKFYEGWSYNYKAIPHFALGKLRENIEKIFKKY